MDAKERNIRLAILRAIRCNRNDLVSKYIVIDAVLADVQCRTSEIEQVLTAMCDSDELYTSGHLRSNTYYGIKNPDETLDCTLACKRAEQLERQIAEAFEGLAPAERRALLARLKGIVDEIFHL